MRRGGKRKGKGRGQTRETGETRLCNYRDNGGRVQPETALFRSAILLCAKRNRQRSSLLALLSRAHSF